MPGHWLACPVWTNATVFALRGAGLWSDSATARKPSRSDPASRNTIPVRWPKWLRPMPAVQGHVGEQGTGGRAIGRERVDMSVEPFEIACRHVAKRRFRLSGERQAGRVARGGKRFLRPRAARRTPGIETAIGRGAPAIQPSPSGRPWARHRRPAGCIPPARHGRSCPTIRSRSPPASGGRSEGTGHGVEADVTRNGSRLPVHLRVRVAEVEMLGDEPSIHGQARS